ncbi:mitochondrial distribution and morphology protein 10 [Paecilomyces variotii]|uniref:Mitochondrial distribution and morphology protein 10 n=1 Tax=Byssochlamys spectabilis TaxID=264951 RepID=A0A443I7R4_BYSSP|nr:mitochondrial distribution and morphology protein 10 [Paecilomyces variotii]RWR00141.1 mitochondrial distribution and morphology protein 10 [Paecilomyces variotii]
MLDFMDYIQVAFADATNWNRDNSYSSLTATAQSLLDFSTPERLRVHLSSLSTPQFATTYTLGTVGLIDGSVSYLFSTLPLNGTPSKSALIPLRKLVPGYRQVQSPVAPVRDWGWDALLEGSIPVSKEEEAQKKATLLHATLHLPPPSTLNALFLRRLSPTTQLSLALCSTRGPPMSKSAPQASVLAQLSHDTGKYSNEYLFSTDNTLFGWRGLWNFGPDPREKKKHGSSPTPLSLLSAGGEAYYSPVSSLVGMSTGLRFSTLPAATDGTGSSSSPISTFPYTLTLTLTPLTGSLSTTYSLRASPNLAFSSRFGFNVYSWESEMVAGCELWRRTRRVPPPPEDDGLEWARPPVAVMSPTLSGATVMPDDQSPPHSQEEETESVVKIRVDQSWNVRILWEGRVKDLLVSAGVGLGPGSFSISPSTPPSPSYAGGSASGQSAGGGAPGMSYWRGVGVSVLYAS